MNEGAKHAFFDFSEMVSNSRGNDSDDRCYVLERRLTGDAVLPTLHSHFEHFMLTSRQYSRERRFIRFILTSFDDIERDSALLGDFMC
jgi:hypothetical protein